MYPDSRPDVWGAMASTTSRFKAVEVHDKSACHADEFLLLHPADVWEKGVPPQQKVELICFSTRRRGGDYFNIIHQLQWRNHSPSDVQYVLGVFPEVLCAQYPLSVPVSLDRRGSRVGYEGYNLTPLHFWFDIHVEHGQDNIFACIGEAGEIWFLWPSTPKDEQEFYSNAYLKANLDSGSRVRSSLTLRFALIATNLEFGRIARPGATYALYVPVGWIHGFLTINGGILEGHIFTATDRLETVLHCLNLEVDNGGNIEELQRTLSLILDMLEMKLVHGKTPQESIRRWLKLLELLRKNKKTRGNNALPATCPFGESGSRKGMLDMAKHVKTHVLEFEIERPVPNKARGRPRAGKAEIKTAEIQTVAKRGSKPTVNPAVESGGDVQEINGEEYTAVTKRQRLTRPKDKIACRNTKIYDSISLEYKK
ncbi:hypothetical protein P167DRAFT_574636 [Morchella conica CCBAS932]|uniref:Uncharacterized protein n=1 Tax=Morchella conica CCBAS932 TaxID=1392247 RepID=A0A3N4L1Y8_9PEZI|nr:hypothetical protein P167DRAFT_574636 [Morchella conica CCBAS932]